MPPAVDFAQGLGHVERVASAKAARGGASEGAVTHRSAVIAAPERFDAVGLAGERRAVEIRARLDGESWSEWIEVANGDPLVVVGGGEEVQLRTRGWRPDGELHYVNVTGTTSAAQNALTGLRSAVSSAFISASELVSPAAEAGVRKPSFVSRKAWGAERDQGGCKPRVTAARGKVKAAAVHHTVTSNSYARRGARDRARDLPLSPQRERLERHRLQRARRSLRDPVRGARGRPRAPVVGAHAQGYNAETTGIAAIGDHSSRGVDGPAFRGLRNHLAWKLDLHGHGARGKTILTSGGGEANRYPRGTKVETKRIFRHGFVGRTACPGDGLVHQMDRLRRETAKRIQG